MEVTWRDVLVGALGLFILFMVLLFYLPLLVPVGLVIAFIVLMYLAVRSFTTHPPSHQR